MRCDEALPLLYDLADGDIDRDGAISVAGHLAGCAACATLLLEIRGRETLYRDRLAPDATVPLRTATELADAVWRNGATRVPLSADRAPLAFAGACAAAAALALAGTRGAWVPAFTTWLDSGREAGSRAAAALAFGPARWGASLGDALSSSVRGLWTGGSPSGPSGTVLAALLLLQLVGSVYLMAPRRRGSTEKETS